MIELTSCVGNDSVSIIGIHLSSNSGYNSLGSLEKVDSFYNRYKVLQEKCKECIPFLKKWVFEHNHPAIVMGDFNNFCFFSHCDSLKDNGMKDSWWIGGFGFDTIFHEG